MGLVNVWKDERDKPNIEITGHDRGRNILYGKRIDDPKIKIVKVGIAVPKPQNYIEIRQGNKVYEQEANSPVRNYYARLIGMVCGLSQLNSSSITIRKQDNTLDTSNYIPNPSYGSVNVETTVSTGYCADGNDDTHGIVVGSGNTAWDFDDYTVETLIQQGTASGKLVYSDTASPIISYVGGVWTIHSRRVFDNFNADANTITVKEVCQLLPFFGYSAALFVYMDERTVLGTPKDIPYKSGAMFTYTRTLTVPALDVLLPNGVSILLGHCAMVNNYDAGDVYGSGHRSLKSIGGDVFSVNLVKRDADLTGNAIYIATAGTLTQGCVIGYGNTAVADGDYTLGSQFAHGTGENQLSYQAQDTPVAVYDSPSKTLTATQSRTATNSYAENQVVREIGIIGGYCHVTIPTSFLMSRTVLGSPVTLAQNESISIIYDFSMVHT
jgi:hypothetical protein